MKIAIHAADLDHARIDGTRVYIKSVLDQLALCENGDEFWIYHQKDFNPVLAPQKSANAVWRKKPFRWLWTQTRFAWEIFRAKPDALWLPMHNLPVLRRKKMRTTVTVHDLAFKIFPQHFPKKDLLKLNLLTDYAVKNATNLIAVSNSTKKDILRFYPQIMPEKISVVHHGFDARLFATKIEQEESVKILAKYQLEAKKYLLYVGAIQPRKNLEVLVAAFEQLKENWPDLKLALVGEKAWLFEKTLARIAQSPFVSDIALCGKVAFAELPVFYQNACAFVFPSLYEGFGIPLLEAFAAKTPVVAAHNSSLPEVGGKGALYFDADDSQALAAQIALLLKDENLVQEMQKKASMQLAKFSWQKCAKQTLLVIKGV